MTKYYDIEDIDIRINDVYLFLFLFIERNKLFFGGIFLSFERINKSEEIKCKYIVKIFV